jgi:hypothetical protein
MFIFICGVKRKQVGLYNFKCYETKFEFVNMIYQYKYLKKIFKASIYLKANKILTYLSWIHNNENISIGCSCKVSSKHYFKIEPLVANLLVKQIGRIS